MFAIYGYTCHICGHPGANEADHLTPISVDPHQPVDPYLMRPSHGGRRGCPYCPRTRGKPRRCNQERGNRPLAGAYTPPLDW